MSDESKRHAKMIANSLETKRTRPDFVVFTPVVKVASLSQEFLESWVENAALGVTMSGVVFYVTLKGKLHRVTIEDLEMEQS